MADIITTAEFKTYAGITSSDYDSIIGTLIDEVTALFEAYTHRTWGETVTETVYFDIDYDDQDMIMVQHFPITSVAGVWDSYDREKDTGTELTENDEYYVGYSTGKIRRADGTYWAQGNQTVKITYSALASIPNDMKLAAKKQVNHEFLTRKGDEAMKSEKIGDYSYTKQDGVNNEYGLLNSVCSILDRHKDFLS